MYEVLSANSHIYPKLSASEQEVNRIKENPPDYLSPCVIQIEESVMAEYPGGIAVVWTVHSCGEDVRPVELNSLAWWGLSGSDDLRTGAKGVKRGLGV